MEREKKHFYIAVKEYNRHHYPPISFAYIASELGISRQALNQLTAYGTKKKFVEYKERLKEILPEELFESIYFPTHYARRPSYKYGLQNKTVLEYLEKCRLKEVSWCIGKTLYDKAMNDKGITEYMHDKIMKKVEVAEKWVEEKFGKSKDKIDERIFEEEDTNL